MVDPAPQDRTWLVVGLGNPGTTYAGNRHNIGAMAVAELAERSGDSLRKHKTQALVATTRLGTLPGGRPGPRAVLAQPLTFMNVSGGPVAALLSYYNLGPESLIVVHDELDIPFGEIRLKLGGGEGGHNGLRSISSSLKTKDYLRVRAGIGRPPGRMDPADYVLSDFSGPQRKELPFLVGDAADAAVALATQGLTEAQQYYHSRGQGA